MPVYLWVKVNETSDLSFILKVRKAINKYQKVFLSIVWKSLQDQYLECFGLGEALEKIVEKQKKLIFLYEEVNANGNKDQLTFVDIEEQELAELQKKIMNHKSDFHITKAKLEKAMGISIDLHKVSVKEYYSYFKALSDGGE